MKNTHAPVNAAESNPRSETASTLREVLQQPKPARIIPLSKTKAPVYERIVVPRYTLDGAGGSYEGL